MCSAVPRLSLQVVVDDWDRMSGNDFIGGAGIALGPMLREARPPDAEPSLVRRVVRNRRSFFAYRKDRLDPPR